MAAKRSRKAPGEAAKFSRREREIMDAVYRLGRGSAAEIREALADPPTYTAIRTLLTILEKKGHVRHRSDGTRYIYEPAVAREQMGRRAIGSVLQTFFDNSVERAVTALLTHEETQVSPDELDRLARLIDKARREGR